MSDGDVNGSAVVETAALARAEPAGLGVSSVRINGWQDVFHLAARLSEARGFVPGVYIGNPNALAAVILTGIEMGMGPMEALRSIHIIEGKPTLSAELMLARARKAGVRTRWARTDATVAELVVTVPGEEPQTMMFTIADAKLAGLAGKGVWQKHPASMLRARCSSMGLRAFCPEVLGAGVYESTSGELSEGVPSAEVLAADPPEPRRTFADALGEIQTPADLKAMLRSKRREIRAEDREEAEPALIACMTRLGVTADAQAATIKVIWGGVEHDPSTGEVPADQEPA